MKGLEVRHRDTDKQDQGFAYDIVTLCERCVERETGSVSCGEERTGESGMLGRETHSTDPSLPMHCELKEKQDGRLILHKRAKLTRKED